MAFYDADTQAAAQASLGRALATFHTPNDDPSVNSYADTNFLRTGCTTWPPFSSELCPVTVAHLPCSNVRTAVADGREHPKNCKLTRYINLPSQWTPRAGSGFDTFLIEGYQYPGINHNPDQASRCAQHPWKELSWDLAHCRYLMGIYYGTWPWLRKFVNVSRVAKKGSGVPQTAQNCRCPCLESATCRPQVSGFESEEGSFRLSATC